jgi:DNA-binding response OmpR family regulator
MGTQRDLAFLHELAQRPFAVAPPGVLIVDPDLTGGQRLAGVLGREQVVAVVGTAGAARAAIAARRPTIVVTELDLPDASGLALLATLHGHAATRHILLMALSRRTSVRDKIAAFQAGADDYLVKPVDPPAFALHVRRLNHFRQILAPDDS